MTKASTAPRMSPGTHTSVRASTARSTVRPRATKATISARLASAVWNRSISRLNGARSSPSTIPATKTARKPDPRARVATREHQQRAGQRPQRVQPLAGQRHPAGEPQQRPPPATPMAAPTAICSRNSPTTCANAPALRPPAAIRLAIRAIPTGSFAPDSPSRMVPLRPEISRWPRTENTTAGSVGATAVANSRARYQARPNAMCTNTAVGGHRQEGADHADGEDRGGRRPEPAPPDVHAAVEQDAHEREGDHPFDGLPRRRVQGRDDIHRDGRARQDERGRGDFHPLGEAVRHHRDQARPQPSAVSAGQMAVRQSRVLPALAGTAAATCPVPMVAAPYLRESPDPYLVTAPTALAAPARSQLCSGPLTTLLRPITTLLRPGPGRRTDRTVLAIIG